MKKKILLLLCLFICSFLIYAQDPSIDPNWRGIFKDKFTNNFFNTDRWIKVNNLVHGQSQKEEPQIYKYENVKVEDEKLVLEAIAENISCPLVACNYNGNHKYTSGEIISVAKYKYGYFEIYAKLPNGQGVWPAFWLWSASGDTITSGCWYNEIDIFEGIGCLSDKVTSCVHWNFDCPRLTDSTNNLPDTIPVYHYSQDYHWYGLEWSANRITWYIDRQKVRSIPNDMDNIGIQNPMMIIINLALLYPSHDCHANTNPDSNFSKKMEIDQVNMYKLKCDKNTVVNEISDYYSFCYAVKKSITLSGASQLSSGQNIFLKATDFIELRPGFEVSNGSQLSLEITSCECECECE